MAAAWWPSKATTLDADSGARRPAKAAAPPSTLRDNRLL